MASRKKVANGLPITGEMKKRNKLHPFLCPNQKRLNAVKNGLTNESKNWRLVSMLDAKKRWQNRCMTIFFIEREYFIVLLNMYPFLTSSYTLPLVTVGLIKCSFESIKFLIYWYELSRFILTGITSLRKSICRRNFAKAIGFKYLRARSKEKLVLSHLW